MQTQAILNLNREQATPHRAAERVDTAALPARMRNYPFFYVCYATGWEFVPGVGFVPTLGEVSLRPGVNGVPLNGDPSKAVAGCLKKGGVVIRDDDPRLGPWQGYLHSYPCAGGGKHYCFKGAEYAVLPGGRVSETDYSGEMLEFRRYLLDHQIVRPMHSSIYQMILEREQKGLERLRKEASQRRRRQEDVDAKEARVAEIRAAWETYCERWYSPNTSSPIHVGHAEDLASRALKPKREKTLAIPTEGV